MTKTSTTPVRRRRPGRAVNIYMDAATEAALSRLAKSTATSRSEIIRDAVAVYDRIVSGGPMRRAARR